MCSLAGDMRPLPLGRTRRPKATNRPARVRGDEAAMTASRRQSLAHVIRVYDHESLHYLYLQILTQWLFNFSRNKCVNLQSKEVNREKVKKIRETSIPFFFLPFSFVAGKATF
jgi:hypothetical protein